MNKSKFIVRTGIIAAVYIVLTVVFGAISYGPIQFRISELLVFLAYINPFYIAGLALGCLISNLFGPMGIYDAIFGTLHTVISLSAMALAARYIKNQNWSLMIASLFPALFSFIIAWELAVFLPGESFWYNYLWVAFGEFVVVTVVGVPFMMYLRRKTNWIDRLKKV